MSGVLETSYARSGFGLSLGMGSRQALIMIDFAKAYFDASSPLYANCDGVRLAAIDLLLQARAHSMPVIHTRVDYDEAGINGGIFFKKIGALSVFCKGSPLGDFAEGLEPAAHEPVVSKQYASAFFGTSLASLLMSQGIDCVLIAGMSTSGCVRASTVDAIQHGFIPVVLEDCVGDRHEAPHKANLFDLAAKYADVRSSGDVFGELAKVSGFTNSRKPA